MKLTDEGVAHIRAMLAWHTGHVPTEQQLAAWCDDIEAAGYPGFEISGYKTLNGKPVVIDLSEKHYEI